MDLQVISSINIKKTWLATLSLDLALFGLNSGQEREKNH